ncbi:hypothetical protein [Paraburkholderia terricola]|uniref:Ribbon-helix-helix protein, copG family n=1 Tax=Paraburkholderia terricola TaxID=169427 RepID=A0ABU1LWC7_9BURK|nr:hypothetical protein [Paraburkholderia terricola]MDR6411052.1 hypothetical protein [Paraburkholderia terricola]MDR6483267.1 hypothetical protein [Paraburkholderia terricola]
MNAPIARKAGKKASRSTENSNGVAAGDGNIVVQSEQPVVDKPVTTKKTAKPKQQLVADVASAPAVAPAEPRAKRARKDKVVRDSFTMPKSDYDKIAALKKKCLDAGVPVKKSELLRAGLLMLESAAPKRLLAAVSSVEAVKTGRPAKA